MGNLNTCGNSPNCVSSQDKRKDFFVKSLPRVNSYEKDKKKLKEICRSMKANLVEEKKDYLHFVYTTPILRFKDDVEFLITDKEIQIRSASRVGYYDFNVNKKRIEKIRELFIS